MLAVLLAGAGRRSGKFRNNVEQPHASNARLPLCLSCLATRIGPGAGTVWSVCVSWQLRPSAAPATRAGHPGWVGTSRTWRGVAGVRYEVRLENWG